MEANCYEKVSSSVWYNKNWNTSLSMEKPSRSTHHRCFVKKGVLKKFRKFQWKTPVLESLFNKVVGIQACNFRKETRTQVLSYEICEISKNTHFEEHLRTATSDLRISTHLLSFLLRYSHVAWLSPFKVKTKTPVWCRCSTSKTLKRLQLTYSPQ